MKLETWKFILQNIAAVLTAIATSLGVSSCTEFATEKVISNFNRQGSDKNGLWVINK